jgi:hypothetical protein
MQLPKLHNTFSVFKNFPHTESNSFESSIDLDRPIVTQLYYHFSVQLPPTTFASSHVFLGPSQCFVVVVPSLLAARRARSPPRFAMPMPFLLSCFMLAFATAECG